VRYSPHEGNHLLTAQLIDCYREVFFDEPWNEWLRCPKCRKYWGIKDKNLLASYGFCHCEVPLVDFWPREQVLSDLYHEITPDASCWLAIAEKSVIGFCWGYPVSIADLERKLDISLGHKFGFAMTEVIAYQDEVGVVSVYRGRKIAKSMVSRRLDDFLAQGMLVGIVRTRQNPEPSQTFLWYTQKLGYQIVATYPSTDGRVVLGRQLAGLKELL